MNIHLIAFIFKDNMLFLADGQLPQALLTEIADDQLHALVPDMHLTVLNKPSGFSLEKGQTLLASPAFVFVDAGKLFWGFICEGDGGEGTWVQKDALEQTNLPSLHKQCAYHAFGLYEIMR